jgi:hypothetical protein
MRKKSSYKPRAIIADTLSYVKSGMKPLTSIGDEAVKLQVKNHDALNNIRMGTGTRADVDTVLTAMNIAEAMAKEAKLGIDWLDELEQAQDAVASMGERGLATGRFVFRGPELTKINLAMEVHDLQLANCTVAELERSINYTKAVIRGGGARRLGPSGETK